MVKSTSWWIRMGKNKQPLLNDTIIKANLVEKIKTHRVQQYGDHQVLGALQPGCHMHQATPAHHSPEARANNLQVALSSVFQTLKEDLKRRITTNSHCACHVGATPASTTTSHPRFWWLPTQFRVLKTTWKGDWKKISREVYYTDSICDRGQDTVTEETDLPTV